MMNVPTTSAIAGEHQQEDVEELQPVGDPLGLLVGRGRPGLHLQGDRLRAERCRAPGRGAPPATCRPHPSRSTACSRPSPAAAAPAPSAGRTPRSTRRPGCRSCRTGRCRRRCRAGSAPASTSTDRYRRRAARPSSPTGRRRPPRRPRVGPRPSTSRYGDRSGSSDSCCRRPAHPPWPMTLPSLPATCTPLTNTAPRARSTPWTPRTVRGDDAGPAPRRRGRPDHRRSRWTAASPRRPARSGRTDRSKSAVRVSVKTKRAGHERHAEHDGDRAQPQPELVREQALQGGAEHGSGTVPRRAACRSRFIRSSTPSAVGSGISSTIRPSAEEQHPVGVRRRRSGRA